MQTLDEYEQTLDYILNKAFGYISMMYSKDDKYDDYLFRTKEIFSEIIKSDDLVSYSLTFTIHPENKEFAKYAVIEYVKYSLANSLSSQWDYKSNPLGFSKFLRWYTAAIATFKDPYTSNLRLLCKKDNKQPLSIDNAVFYSIDECLKQRENLKS